MKKTLIFKIDVTLFDLTSYHFQELIFNFSNSKLPEKYKIRFSKLKGSNLLKEELCIP